eukprot:13015835-Alexandrium_andersonii.AAC.1
MSETLFRNISETFPKHVQCAREICPKRFRIVSGTAPENVSEPKPITDIASRPLRAQRFGNVCPGRKHVRDAPGT